MGKPILLHAELSQLTVMLRTIYLLATLKKQKAWEKERKKRKNNMATEIV